MNNRDLRRMEPIVPERDDQLSRRPAAGASNNRKETSKTPPENSGNGSGFLKLMVVLLLIGLGAVAWFAWQQSLALQDLGDRFQKLSDKIESTDESLSQSGAAISVKLKDQDEQLTKHWSEIKKLWGVAHDNNRKAIAANKSALDKQAATLKKTSDSVAGLRGSLDQVTTKLDAIRGSTLEANVELEELRERMQVSADRLNNIDQSLKQLQNGLNRRVAENEEAIASFDAYRRQINEQLARIRQQLGTP